MKVIYCPPGQDPQEAARNALRRRTDKGGFMQENWWLILGVIAFLVVGFTVGPFKGILSTETPVVSGSQDATATPAPVIETPPLPVFCDKPGGGLIADGDTAWVDHTTEVSQYRCNGGKLVKLQTITQTLQAAP